MFCRLLVYVLDIYNESPDYNLLDGVWLSALAAFVKQ